MPCSPSQAPLKKVLVEDIRQWTELKRGQVQPLFDAVTVMPLLDLANYAALIQASVVFGTNKFAMGTRYQDLGMTLRNAALWKPLPGTEQTQQQLDDTCGNNNGNQEGDDEDEGEPPEPPPSSGSVALLHTPSSISRDAAAQVAADSPLPGSLDQVPGRLHPESPFPGGVIYATERVFRGSCEEAFKGMFEAVLMQKP